MKIVVYTAITGGYDPPKRDMPRGSANFVLFTDNRRICADAFWNTRPACDLYVDSRRNARHHKLLPHIYFPDADWWVWLDGSMSLKITPDELVEKYAGPGVTAFRHPDRDCLFSEAEACKILRLGRRELIDAQVRRYMSSGMPLGYGLAETKCVVRKNEANVVQFNQLWHHELVAGSVRDQISINYVEWRTGHRITYMDPLLYRGGSVFDYQKHVQKRYA